MIKKRIICGIYKITNPIGESYIGASKNITSRWYKHKYLRKTGKTKIAVSLHKYGVKNHIFEIIEECEYSKLIELEEYYIKKFQTFNTKKGLNSCSGGISVKYCDETKNKIREKATGRTHSSETKLKITTALIGKTLTEEQLKNRNKNRNQSGEKNGNARPDYTYILTMSKLLKESGMKNKKIQELLAIKSRGHLYQLLNTKINF